MNNTTNSWWQKRFIKPLVRFLKQGISPKKLALTVAIGAMVGISPFFGLTTLICILFATVFRLNQAAIQVANYMVYPLQLVLIVPNIRAGECIFHIEHFPLSVEKIKMLYAENWFDGLLTFSKSMLIGGGFWLLYAIPLGIFVYLSLIPVFKKTEQRIKENQKQQG